MRKCPTEAILGQPNKIHYIIEDKCIGCGSCFDVCPHDAVRLAEPAALDAAAQQEEAEMVRSVFAPSVFEDWHEGKKLLRME